MSARAQRFHGLMRMVCGRRGIHQEHQVVGARQPPDVASRGSCARMMVLQMVLCAQRIQAALFLRKGGGGGFSARQQLASGVSAETLHLHSWARSRPSS